MRRIVHSAGLNLMVIGGGLIVGLLACGSDDKKESTTPKEFLQKQRTDQQASQQAKARLARTPLKVKSQGPVIQHKPQKVGAKLIPICPIALPIFVHNAGPPTSLPYP